MPTYAVNVVKKPLDIETDALIIPVLEGGKKLSAHAASVDHVLSKKISDLVKKKVITGKKGELNVIHALDKSSFSMVILVGVGNPDALNLEVLRNLGGDVARCLNGLQCKTALWVIDELPLSGPEAVSAIVEGTEMGAYRFETFRSKTEALASTLSRVEFVVTGELEALKAAVQYSQEVGRAVCVARDLANTPSNHLTPSMVVAWAKSTFKKGSDVALEVIDEKVAKKLGMGMFLSVAQGSAEPPFMIVMRYNGGAKSQKPVALVGKGVTFDTGGISIKPSSKMSEMKGDMSGAAAVLATMKAVDVLKPKKNIIAIVGLTENMPSGTAIKPGDVVTAMNGKTVEIINTDAEGRLVLGDALSYVVKEGVQEIVDLATLTGACSIALGDVAAAILGNNQDLVNQWLEISRSSGERLWQLPLYEEYMDYMKSEVADMVNAFEGRLAGTCTAAKFLEQFVSDTPWVHLDIASLMHYSVTKGYTVKGMSGAGVRNLIPYVMR